MTDTLPSVQLPARFKVRLDPYWQSVAVYAVTLLIYVAVKAMWDTTLQRGIVNVVLTDPIFVLLGVFIIVSLVALIVNSITRRSILVKDDGITFRSRFHERTFTLGEIEKIVVGRDRRIRIRGMLSMIKVHIKGRRRALRIRPAVFEDETELVSALLTLRKATKDSHE